MNDQNQIDNFPTDATPILRRMVLLVFVIVALCVAAYFRSPSEESAAPETPKAKLPSAMPEGMDGSELPGAP